MSNPKQSDLGDELRRLDAVLQDVEQLLLRVQRQATAAAVVLAVAVLVLALAVIL